ncbi:MAG: tetratricopeptide repeat protein [Candidatus Aminicenantes bacterium]|nr:tetratricopeptide repeat protein [Candidatus Aminicenantes bacterium]
MKRNTIEKTVRYILILFLLVLLLPVRSWTQGVQAEQTGPDDKELLEKAKLEIFDRNWDPALKKLEHWLAQFPKSPNYPSALFYKGWCLKELDQVKPALEAYTEYLKISTNSSLREEAEIAMIDLDFQLYQKGEKQYLAPVIGFLESGDRMVRYYAAFKLSYADDKKIAETAVPVLKKIVAGESDDELVDRAKLALMRINPDHLKEVAKTRGIEKQMLHIQAYDKKTKKDSFSITIPFVLAKLALDSVPEKEKEMLTKKGYNVARLLATLAETPELVRIESEDVVFKIWVD